MEKVERFYIGPQIEMPKIRSEASAGGVPTVAVAKAGNLVFTNGVVSNHPETGEHVAGDIRVQTRQVLENLKMGLEKAGTGFENVVMVHAFLRNMEDWPTTMSISSIFQNIHHRHVIPFRPRWPRPSCWLKFT
jgi:enamine deaminase RidA (YjgF/YER057c/UK114 family)